MFLMFNFCSKTVTFSLVLGPDYYRDAYSVKQLVSWRCHKSIYLYYFASNQEKTFFQNDAPNFNFCQRDIL